MIAMDAAFQQESVKDKDLYIPKYIAASPPHADLAALRETAKLLVNASNPVIIADRVARSEKGIKSLVELAELIQCPVVNQPNRVNFPNTHHLRAGNAAALVRNADVIMGLELTDFWNTVNGWVDNGDHDGHGLNERRSKPDAKLISISSVELLTKANYQDFQRFQPVDILMPADAETSLPYLIEAVKSAITPERKAAFEKRGEALKKSYADSRQRAREAAALGWDTSPITTARLCAEIYAQIKDLDWSLVAQSGNVSGWQHRLWPMDKHYRWLGGSGASGLGYGAPASIGAAHGNKSLGRFSVSIQSDGDLMYVPGSLWTAAHHNIPLLAVMHNNRGYHQEVMHVQRLSNRRNRVAALGKTMGPIGTSIEAPDIDYAKLSASMGWTTTGPIKDPAELGPALKRAVAAVKAGEPALVDVWTQAR
jgi:thiamine pyrophosphate-dependent acetolactate synthase large subunit-like protein